MYSHESTGATETFNNGWTPDDTGLDPDLQA